MKSFFCALCGLLCCLVLPARAGTLPPREQAIERTLAAMTLPEKVGQMTLLTFNTVAQGTLPFGTKEPHRLDPERLWAAIGEHHVGAIFNTGLHALTLPEWRSVVTGIEAAAARTRLKIPVLYGIDAVHGMSYACGATLFPQQIGLAATWDPGLVGKIARATAYEARAAFIPLVFAPSVDLGRNPVHSRFYETFGEDTLLASRLGAAMVRGFQGNNLANPYRVAATLKHFVGYTMPVTGKDRTPAAVPEVVLQENFIPPFRAGIEAGAAAVMLANCELNGVPVHADRHLITDVLKNSLGFRGVVMSDWGSVYSLSDSHHVARDRREAVKLAVNAGLDLAMVPFDLDFTTLLVDLVKKGEVPMARIDDAVRRVLGLKYDLGLLTGPPPNAGDYPDFGSQRFADLNRRAARASLTLLKNEKSVLPLPKTARVLVTGFGADSMAALNGGWTYTWRGQDTDRYAADKSTILKAIAAKLGPARVEHVAATYDEPADLGREVAAARRADAVVLCLGEEPYAENFGNIDDLSLPESQTALARALAATGKPVILVLTEGRPRIIRPFVDQMAAVLLAYLPGNEGGNAIADVLFGDAGPEGRLPFTYPRGPNGLGTYDHKISEGYAQDPEFPFGAGLSYSRFRYSGLALDKAQVTATDVLTVSVAVRNDGRRPATETVQLYVSDLVASIPPPVKRLRGFRKVALAPGEQARVSFSLPIKDLAFMDRNGTPILEPGEFEVAVGGLHRKFVVR